MRYLLLFGLMIFSVALLAASQDAQPNNNSAAAAKQPSPAPASRANLWDSSRENDNATCYTLRVFTFERKGTEAPRLTGSRTCTPASDLARRIEGSRQAPPKPRYLPQ